MTASIVSDTAPTVELKRTGTLGLKSWWQSDEKKAEEGEVKKE